MSLNHALVLIGLFRSYFTRFLACLFRSFVVVVCKVCECFALVK